MHVWAGISERGRTGICVFEGIMKKELLKFLRAPCYLSSTMFIQMDISLCWTMTPSTRPDMPINDNGVNWWKTPAESPDMNPIENLWHKLKEYIRREEKPKTKDQLIEGILEFWRTVHVNKCKKYIGHLKKVIPKVIELEGAATGY